MFTFEKDFNLQLIIVRGIILKSLKSLENSVFLRIFYKEAYFLEFAFVDFHQFICLAPEGCKLLKINSSFRTEAKID